MKLAIVLWQFICGIPSGEADTKDTRGIIGYTSCRVIYRLQPQRTPYVPAPWESNSTHTLYMY